MNNRDTDNIGYTRHSKQKEKINTETLTTSDTQDTGQNKHQSKQKGQSRMNNTETLTTSDTQDTGQNKHQSKQSRNNTETLTTSDTQDTDKINTRVNRRDNQE